MSHHLNNCIDSFNILIIFSNIKENGANQDDMWDRIWTFWRGHGDILFSFENKMDLNMSNLTFELAKCKAARKNCNQYTKCDLYKRFNSSDGIKCTKKISLVAEITSTSTFWYYIFVGNTIYYNIGRIRDLQCICKEYDFSQIVEKDFPQLGKANVEIKDFYNVPELTTTYLTVIPNNNLNIEQRSTKRFQLSALDLCQTYRLTVTIESEPTCINWKINSNLTFSLEIDNATTFSCQYNGTAITIGTSAENDSRVYYKVISRIIISKAISQKN